MAYNEQFLIEAIRLSREKMEADEGGPFGAVIVWNGKIIARGWNRVTSGNDPTAHAEVEVIRSACRALATFSLEGCELYASCEPCPMCLAAIYWARLDAVYYAASREDAAAVGFDDALLYEEIAKPVPLRSKPSEQHLRSDAQAVFTQWMEKPDRLPY